MEKGNKKIIRGWIFYDWANSVYNLVISSAIFPIFYNSVTTAHYLASKGREDGELNLNEIPTIDFFGITVSTSVLFSMILAASFLVVSFLSPLLSGVADYSGNKKKYMQFFCYLGAFSCMSLSMFSADYIELSMLSVFLASIGFWNSLVFYNAYLPEIADVEDHDKISAKGFSMGYIGSMILLVVCLIIVKNDPLHTKWCFILVGLWWIGFSQITYRVLPNNVYNKPKRSGIIWQGFRELKRVFKDFKKTYRLKKFLIAFFFYNTGVQTVMLMAVIFAEREISWPDPKDKSGLIIAILLIQILGACGAFLMSRLSRILGNIKTLTITVVFWIILCFCAFVIQTPVEFYFLASGVGLVMGGVQALSRSTYSKFLPETTDHASYFSFYDVTEKVGIVFGLTFFGLSEIYFSSIRYSVLSIAAFFIIGLILLFFVPKDEKPLEISN